MKKKTIKKKMTPRYQANAFLTKEDKLRVNEAYRRGVTLTNVIRAGLDFLKISVDNRTQ